MYRRILLEDLRRKKSSKPDVISVTFGVGRPDDAEPLEAPLRPVQA